MDALSLMPSERRHFNGVDSFPQTRRDRRHAPHATSSGLNFLVRESGSPEPAGEGDLARMSAKISVARDGAAQSTVNHRAAKRPLSPGK